MNATFDYHQRVTRIVLAGCGGTGAQWARSIARILYDMRARQMDTPAFEIVDPDVVEPHNVGRQLFTPADVGLFKSQIIAERLGFALGLNITWRSEHFNADRYKNPVVVCGAVDNHVARAEIARMGFYGSPLWIDAGNTSTGGQVIIGNHGGINPIDLLSGVTAHLPIPTKIFPSLLEPDPAPAPDLSCAELIEAGQQHLLINDLMAVVGAQYLYKVLHRQPITSFMTYVDLDTLGMRSLLINADNLEVYGIEVNRHKLAKLNAAANGNGNGAAHRRRRAYPLVDEIGMGLAPEDDDNLEDEFEDD